jgi:hypothetical protein
LVRDRAVGQMSEVSGQPAGEEKGVGDKGATGARPSAPAAAKPGLPRATDLGALDDRFGDDRGARSTSAAPKRKASPPVHSEAKRRSGADPNDIDARFGGEDAPARQRNSSNGRSVSRDGGRARDDRSARDDRERDRDYRERERERDRDRDRFDDRRSDRDRFDDRRSDREHDRDRERDRDRDRERERDRERDRERERAARDSNGDGKGDGKGDVKVAPVFKPKPKGPRYVGTQEEVQKHHSSIDERFDDERFDVPGAERTPAQEPGGTAPPSAAGTPRKQPTYTQLGNGADAEKGGVVLEKVRNELTAARRELAERDKRLLAAERALADSDSQLSQLQTEAAAKSVANPGDASAPADGGSGGSGGSVSQGVASGREAELASQIKERDAKLQTLREAHKASLAEKTKRMQELRAELAEKETRLTALRESHKLSLTEW